MTSVLIIGAGGVGNVTVKKCVQAKEVFSKITLASRTLSKCEAIQQECGGNIDIAQVDADDTTQVADLIRKTDAKIVINVALPYQDLTIMQACIETGVHYIDTANYEPKDEAKFEYKEQWALHDEFTKAQCMAVLGAGFDPGVTNAYCAYAQKHFFDEIHTIDILDCNAGDHHQSFATNFNPEINIREITQKGKYWEGKWKETEPLSVSFDFDYPQIGPRPSYLLYHEEEESLVKNIKGLKRIRFWMTFGEAYIKHLDVIQSLGLNSIKPIDFNGQQIVPLEFLKALLPDPATLGTNYEGKTNIGCVITGLKDGKTISKYIYNVCDHAQTFKEVGAQAVSYTAGVPPAVAAILLANGTWKGVGVFNVEQLDPDPFLEELAQRGLPWEVTDFHGTVYDK